MDLPKCRTCGDRHRLGPCPSTQSKSDGGVESRNAPKTDAQPQVGGTKAAGLLRRTDSSVGRAGPSQGSGRQFEAVSDSEGVAPLPSGAKDTEPKFDRAAYHRNYMREYMRKRRQKDKK